MNWIDQILMFSVALGVLMSGLIWSQKRDSDKRNPYFALLVFLVSLQIAKDVPAFGWHPAAYIGLQGTCLFLGPTVYLYTLYMLGVDVSLRQNAGKHYRIGVIYLLVVLSLVLLIPNSPLIHQFISPPIAITIVYTLLFAQLYHVLWYFLRSLRRIRIEKESDTSTLKTSIQRHKWLLTVVVALTVVILAFLLPLVFLTAFSDSEVLNVLKYGFLLTLSLGLNIVTIKSFNYPEIVLSLPAFKYADSNLSSSKLEFIQSRLGSLMNQERPYLDSELKLNEMARMMAVRPVHLSQVINDQYGKNFSEYINTYRVNEAKRILKEDQDLSIYEVALDAGFNSKATFNRVFKQMTGTTPTRFRSSQESRTY